MLAVEQHVDLVPDGMDLDGMLNFHIKTIRRALADDANDPRYIETKLG